jgi:hypothetical protein
MSRPTLLTTSNPKTSKSREYGYHTAVLHLAPHKLSGFNVCPHASPGCASLETGCLNRAGRGGIPDPSVSGFLNRIERCRIERTRFFFEDKREFLVLLFSEIVGHCRRSDAAGLLPAIRLNGTSDLPWESIAPDLFARFSDVQVYDYTKSPSRYGAFLRGDLPPNYYLTFSRSETNSDHCQSFLHQGGTIAVVWNLKRYAPLPSSWHRWPIIDADVHDLRFLDKPGTVAGLRAKGPAKRDSTGFVLQVA